MNGIRDSSVSIATGYELYGQVSILAQMQWVFLYSLASRLVLETNQPPIQWVLGEGVLYWG
jgi:hypothetical protein